MKRFLSLLVVLGGGTAHADQTFNSGSGTTWDCAKDDDVTINTSSGNYTFKGACKDINVNGSSLTITIESVEDLTVNGGKNTVSSAAVDDININGAGNTVTWGKGIKHKAPKVSNLGTGNTVKTGTVTAPATAAPDEAATGDTVLDCAAQPAVSITKGGGSYKIIGTCAKVAIAGSDNKVSIEAAKNVAVTGSSNVVSVDKADKIAAMGSKNKVTYGGGLTVAKPKTASTGKGNTIVQTTATAPVTDQPVDKTTKTGAIAPIPHDCTKAATKAISTNDGSYVFTGKCTAISVDGNNNSLKVESAKALGLNGNNNTVDVTAVDKLSTTGNDNTVRWKKGVSGAKAKVSNLGNGNTVAQTK